MEAPIVIELPSKHIKALRWVLKAASKDDTRLIMQCIHINGSRMTASDGFRIHTWDWQKEEITPFPQGSYQVLAIVRKLIVLQKADETLKLPDFDVIMNGFDKTGMDGKEGKVITRSVISPKFLMEAYGYSRAIVMEIGHFMARLTINYFLDEEWTMKALIMCMHSGNDIDPSNHLQAVPA